VKLLTWALPVAAATIYTAVSLASGNPQFPSRSDCVHPVRGEGNIEAVFGRFSSSAAAEALLHRALRSGFTGTRIEGDGCGLLKVTLPGIPSIKVGRAFVAEARAAGYHPVLEQSAP
jgi:hypothetical protein